MGDSLIRALKRFIHWGPCTAIGIIKCVTLTTLYMNSMWWPPNRTLGGMLHQTLFLILSAMSVFNYVMATICGPGFLPFKWLPEDEKAKDNLQYCKVCEGYKAPRSHHCRKCGRCVMKMDHHCPWLNCCVGWSNHAYFTAFLIFSVIGCVQSTIILAASFYHGIHRSWYIYSGQPQLVTVNFGVTSLAFCIFSLGLSVGVVIAVGMLLFFQVRCIVRNRTAIEDWILEKAKFRREGTEDEFLFPYDLGTLQNIAQVANWSCVAIGDGINWKVREGCDQYTLTIEQIEQKLEKRARTRTYTIVRTATGSWFPLRSQGFAVCIHPPCTDEPRIRLHMDDIVNVTRWKKYWLFGEIINSKDSKTQGNNAKSERCRGWFPRKCAVELVCPDSNEDQEHFSEFNNKKIN